MGYSISLGLQSPRDWESVSVVMPCPMCEKSVYAWGETDYGAWNQHGVNPEHRKFLRRGEATVPWLREIHEYEKR